MAGETMQDMDREYLISAALGALTKTYKKGRLGTTLAGEQVLCSVIGHRLAMGTSGYVSIDSTYKSTTAGNTGGGTTKPPPA
jgi:hypothetical protein